jgi:hypothetical protein
MTLYRQLMEKNYFQRSQLSQTSFYRMVRGNDLLNVEQTKKLRHSFCMQLANELWQADDVQEVQVPRAQDAQKRPPCMALPSNKLMGNGVRLF